MEKHFICEFVTAGGMRDRSLPETLRHEGAMLRDTLLDELSDQPRRRLSLSFDDRLPRPPCAQGQPIGTAHTAWRFWARHLDEVDYFWPVAPETGGALYRLTRMAESRRARTIGCPAAGIAACANKWQLYRTLRRHGLPCARTRRLGEGPEALPTEDGWVVKPILGAGCQDCRWLDSREQVHHFMRHCPKVEDYILQEWVTGQALSLSTLMCDGKAAILSCNQQQVATGADGSLSLHGLLVNARAPDARQNRLVQTLAQLFPELTGFVGMDLVATGHGYRLLEINPRLTSALGGLSAVVDRPLTTLLQELFARRAIPAFRRSSRALALDLAHRP